MKNSKKSVLFYQLYSYGLYFCLTIGFVGMNSITAYCQSSGSVQSVETNYAVLTSNKENEFSTWTVDKVHSKVGFSITHLVISEVEGTFKVYDGEIKTGSDDFTDAKINFLVDVASLNTENTMRDDHLKSDDFFNAEQYPQMKFESTSFKKIAGQKYRLKGNLTIRETTKPVIFEVKHGGIAPNDGYGNTKAGFKATTTINRFDYGLKWNSLTEAGGLTVGDEVEIELKLQFALNK